MTELGRRSTDATALILEELKKGDRTKGYLVDETGYHRNTVDRHLALLETAGVIEVVHESTALYRYPDQEE